jgi:Ni,Fe-hydrogenase III small subunit
MECSLACPHKALSFTHDYKLAATTRAGLCAHDNRAGRDGALPRELADLFGQSLKLRQVSAAGCNACEADTNVLNTLTYDLGRFGIQFVASPRHADGILVTGPISKNMELALKKTYDAVPSPKIVIAVGSCAISGGIFRDHAETAQGLDTIIPVDLYIPGCPPHPYTILDGLLKLIGKVK